STAPARPRPSATRPPRGACGSPTGTPSSWRTGSPRGRRWSSPTRHRAPCGPPRAGEAERAVSRALESLLVGRVLAGRYEVQEVVGRGGMSIVYRAFDRRLERQV